MQNNWFSSGLFVLSFIAFFSFSSCSIAQESPLEQETDLFLSFFSPRSNADHQESIKALDQNWQEGYAVMVLEVIYLLRNREVSDRLLRLLQRKTGQQTDYAFNDWYTYLWQQSQTSFADYDNFKARLYQRIDPVFGPYFQDRGESAKIRLDEVRWGGVLQDGIPPLRQPEMIAASEAQYLNDDNVVFGIAVNGDVRAYPKRILAWHEMFVDEVGGVPVAGVYCTLCGTVILYKTEHEGVRHQMGTSGFLYRSNKLMYDRATQSLWNTLQGEPVIGPLAGKGIQFDYLSVVTTTWGEWRKRHPETKVLSLNTGHRRDYGEGVAYQQYFGTDALMFNTPFTDRRLKNKAEVLSLRQGEDQLAISARYLKKRPVYHTEINGQKVVIFTDRSGANRVYEAAEHSFTDYDQLFSVIDDTGQKWEVKEHELIASDGQRLKRFPAHRTFWFGWRAAYPETRLVK
ncbi:MAG: DUF3179 domain-containing protein [Bacteroidota bacterium]